MHFLRFAVILVICFATIIYGNSTEDLLKRIYSVLTNTNRKVGKIHILLEQSVSGKLAVSSSQATTETTAAHAVDNDIKTMLHTGLESNPYLIVDLGDDFKVKRIDVFNRKDCCGERLHDLDILFGLSHNTLSLCAHYKGPARSGDNLIFFCRPERYARYVKLAIKGKEYLQVVEVKVYAERTG